MIGDVPDLLVKQADRPQSHREMCQVAWDEATLLGFLEEVTGLANEFSEPPFSEPESSPLVARPSEAITMRAECISSLPEVPGGKIAHQFDDPSCSMGSRWFAIVGDENDPILVAVAAELRRIGDEPIWLPGKDRYSFSVRLGDDGLSGASLMNGDGRVIPLSHFAGGICRGFVPGSEIADAFAASEVRAGWWALLSCIPGRVVNRPSALNMSPFPDLLPLSGLLPRDSCSFSATESLGFSIDTPMTQGSRVIIDAVSLRMDRGRAVDRSQGLRTVGFDSQSIKHVVIAGRAVLDLSVDPVVADCQMTSTFLENLRVALYALGIGFMFLVIEEVPDAPPVILYATSFPNYTWIEHRLNTIVDSLASFLLN